MKSYAVKFIGEGSSDTHFLCRLLNKENPKNISENFMMQSLLVVARRPMNHMWDPRRIEDCILYFLFPVELSL